MNEFQYKQGQCSFCGKNEQVYSFGLSSYICLDCSSRAQQIIDNVVEKHLGEKDNHDSK